jgi:hypothetical protein
MAPPGVAKIKLRRVGAFAVMVRNGKPIQWLDVSNPWKI